MSLVPTIRLLGVVFAAALVAVAAGPWPELRPVWLLAMAGIALVAMADMAWSLARSRPPLASVPPVTRFLRDRVGAVPVTFANPDSQPRRVRFALGLPADFEPAQEEAWVDLPAGTTRARIEWRAIPRQRGRFTGLLACVEGNSVLGLWCVRLRTPLAGELRVHSNLLTERRNVAALFLARGRPGAQVQATVGRGREFDKLREYLPGDDFDEIHWKATAKRGRPVTKIFQAERTQEIYVVIDSSRLSARPVVIGGVPQTALERCITAALVVLLAAERQGDKFGLVAHDERVRVFVRAGSGSAHYAACREAVLGLRPSEATPDVPEIFRHLRTQLRQRALLFFLTDLTDPVVADDFLRHVRLLSRQHLVLVGQLRPPGVAPLFAAPVTTSDEVYERLAGHARWAEARTLGQKLKPLGVTSLLLDDATMAAQLVTEYLGVKRRQAL